MTSDENPSPQQQAEGLDVLELARAGMEQARRKAGDVIAATREKGEAVIDETREKTYRAAAETNRLFQEHPIAAVAAAAAAGAVIGIFMPRIAIAGKAGQLAGRAIKAAVATEAAQLVVSGLKDSRDAALRSAAGKAAGKAASVAARRIRTRQPKMASTAQVAKPQTTADEG